MIIREPGSLSRANGAYWVLDHFLRGWEVNEEEEEDQQRPFPAPMLTELFKTLTPST